MGLPIMWRFSNLPTEMLRGAMFPQVGVEGGTGGVGGQTPGQLGGSGAGGPPIGGGTGLHGGGWYNPNGPGSVGRQTWAPQGALQRLLATIVQSGPVGDFAHALRRGNVTSIDPVMSGGFYAHFGQNGLKVLNQNPEWLQTLNNLGGQLANSSNRADRQLNKQQFRAYIRTQLR